MFSWLCAVIVVNNEPHLLFGRHSIRLIFNEDTGVFPFRRLH
jgi:hypothetical protein